MTTTKHTNCTHPATKAARAACRKGKPQPIAAPDATGPLATDFSGLNPGPVDYSAYAFEFERQTCWKCSGSGQYPSSAWNGICLACNGKGRSLTPAGRRAQKAYQIWLETNSTKSATDVAVGDRVMINNQWYTIAAMSEPRVSKWTEGGVAKEMTYVQIDTPRQPAAVTLTISEAPPVIVAPVGEARAAMIQRLLKLNGVTVHQQA